jgi:hypothetical protein
MVITAGARFVIVIVVVVAVVVVPALRRHDGRTFRTKVIR